LALLGNKDSKNIGKDKEKVEKKEKVAKVDKRTAYYNKIDAE
jgi:hypothetical protein